MIYVEWQILMDKQKRLGRIDALQIRRRVFECTSLLFRPNVSWRTKRTDDLCDPGQDDALSVPVGETVF